MHARPVAILTSLIVIMLSVTASAQTDDAIGPVETVPTGSVMPEDPWIMAGDEEAIMLTGYVTLKSDANTPWSLEKVTARGFRSVMIHRAVLQDGETRMALQNTLTIPPGETVTMGKEGYHLMFMGPRQKLKDGDKVAVILYFKGHEPTKLVFPVQKGPPAKKK